MRFLIVDDDPEYRRLLRYHLEVEWPDARIGEHQPSSAGTTPATLPLDGVDVVLLGHPLAGERELFWLRQLRARADCPPIVLFAESSDEFLAVDALKAGAASYFPRLELRHRRLVDTLRAEAGAAEASGGAAFAAGTVEASGRDAFGAGAAFAPGPVEPSGRDASTAGAAFASRDRSASGAGRARRHRFVETLHSTDLSSIYLAESEDGAERVVYKVLHHVPDAGGGRLFDRFLQEYEIIAAVNHPNVVRIFGLGIADDHAYIVMEHIPGGSLAGRIAGGAMEADEALLQLRRMAGALGAIHAAGVLHRDLKPGNVLFREDDTLALIDFGLAKRLRFEAAITGTGQIFGTPYYMSPEQGHAEPTDQRSDLYSLGCIFYEMLTGMKPFTADSAMGVIYKHAHAPRPRLPAALAHLQPCLDRLLAVRPAERFRSAAELLEALGGEGPDPSEAFKPSDPEALKP